MEITKWIYDSPVGQFMIFLFMTLNAEVIWGFILMGSFVKRSVPLNRQLILCVTLLPTYMNGTAWTVRSVLRPTCLLGFSKETICHTLIRFGKGIYPTLTG